MKINHIKLDTGPVKTIAQQKKKNINTNYCTGCRQDIFKLKFYNIKEKHIQHLVSQKTLFVRTISYLQKHPINAWHILNPFLPPKKNLYIPYAKMDNYKYH